jgi:hypothetical protein
MKEKELLYRMLVYNYHRMCMISALLWMISRKPKDHQELKNEMMSSAQSSWDTTLSDLVH